MILGTDRHVCSPTSLPWNSTHTVISHLPSSINLQEDVLNWLAIVTLNHSSSQIYAPTAPDVQSSFLCTYLLIEIVYTVSMDISTEKKYYVGMSVSFFEFYFYWLLTFIIYTNC